MALDSIFAAFLMILFTLIIVMYWITDYQHMPTASVSMVHWGFVCFSFSVCYMLSRRSTRPVLAAARVCRVRVGVRGGPEVCELLKRVWMPVVAPVCVSGGLMGFRGSD